MLLTFGEKFCIFLHFCLNIHILLIPAFHILKDASIQLTVEKVPIDENSHFSFLPFEEPYQSTGLLRVDGRFVNAVQVNSGKILKLSLFLKRLCLIFNVSNFLSGLSLQACV